MLQRIEIAGAAFCLLACGAYAQGVYPTRPIRVIVPSAAGGGTDIVARILAPRVAEHLGQTVVVDNRPGAGTMIGMELVAKATPDGYTLLLAPTTLAMNSAIYRKVPYDPVRDFAPVTRLVGSTNIIVVHPSMSAPP